MVAVDSFPAASVEKEQTKVPDRVTWKPIAAKSRSKSEPINTTTEKLDPAAQTTKDVESAATVPRTARPKNADVTSAQPQSGELDTLTASDLRASMGKSKRHDDTQEVVAEDVVVVSV